MHLISTEYVDLDGTSPIILKKNCEQGTHNIQWKNETT